MKKKLDPIYERILKTLQKYSDNNIISRERASYAIGSVHKFGKPYSTLIISNLSRMGRVKFNGYSGHLTLLVADLDFNQELEGGVENGRSNFNNAD